MTRLLPYGLALALASTSCGKKDGASSDSQLTSPGTGAGPTTGATTGVPPGTTPPECDLADPTGDPTTIALTGDCPLETREGAFTVSLLDIFSIVDGQVADGTVPITILEELGTVGSCTLKRRNNPFCDPSCAPTETCDFDGQCIPFPLNQDVGLVTVAGLKEDVCMYPIPPGNNYFDTDLPHPACDPGDLVELHIDGGAYMDPMTLHGVCPDPLVLTTMDWVIRDGEDLAIAWEPPSVPVNPGQHLQVRLNIDQHGITPVSIFCEFPDDGADAIPAQILTDLKNYGVTGFPNATVTRRTADSGTNSEGGCVEFLVTGPAEPNVQVEGFIPCTLGGAPCPSGMTCDVYTGLCV